MRIPMLLTLMCLLVGCGGSGDSLEEEKVVEEAIVEPDPTIRTTHLFGQNGNLWKPKGDEHASGGGNLVVLFSAQFAQQFDNCEVAVQGGGTAQLFCLNNQPWTQIPYSCFSNGNRQTWRASFPCSSAAEVKVTCRLPGQEFTFTVPDAQKAGVCSRWG